MLKTVLLSTALAAAAIAVAAPAQALPTSGTFLVPSEIAPGTYRVVPTHPLGGYYAVCGDYACEPGGDDSMIRNNYINDGSAIMVVPPNAVSVELDDLAITKLN